LKRTKTAILVAVSIAEALRAILAKIHTTSHLRMALKQAVIPLSNPQGRNFVQSAKFEHIKTGTGGAADRTGPAPQAVVCKLLPLRICCINFATMLLRNRCTKETSGIFRYRYLTHTKEMFRGLQKLVTAVRLTGNNKAAVN
jgi:hypothetical protein